jgi:hypothetical protein
MVGSGSREDPVRFQDKIAEIVLGSREVPVKKVATETSDSVVEKVACIANGESNDPIPCCSYRERRDKPDLSGSTSVLDEVLTSDSESLSSEDNGERDESYVSEQENVKLKPIHGEMESEFLACKGLRRFPHLRIRNGDPGDIYVRRDGKCITFSGSLMKPLSLADFGIDENDRDSSSEEMSSGEMFLMSSDDDDYEPFVPAGGESGGEGDNEGVSDAEEEEAPLG